MTPLDQAATSLLGALGAAVLKATLLLAMVAGTASLLRRRTAALKHAIWTMALGATVAMLLLPAVVPGWCVIHLPALSLGGARGSATRSSAMSAEVKAAIEHDEDAVTLAGAVFHFSSYEVTTLGRRARAARLVTDHWPSLLAALWLGGAILVLSRHMLGVVALRRLCRRARILGDSVDAVLGRRLAADLHIRRTVTFLSSDDIELPLAWGMVHPCVVLPGHAGDWRGDRLQHVLQHELAHVKRLDAGTQLVAGAACALFWFHPLVRHAARQMRHERERACDDRVLALGVVPSAYASDLLALVEAYGPTDRHHAALAMARGSTLEGRLLALLDPTVERGVAPRGHLAIAFLLAILFAVPAAALRAASPTSPTTIAATPTRHEVAAIEPAALVSARDASPLTVPHRAARTVHLADLFDGCPAGQGSHVRDSRDPVDGRRLWTVSARSGDCHGELIVHGDTTFNRDVTGFERLSDSAAIDITASIHGDTTRLVARASAEGDITYTFVRNGQPADFDTDGRAWLAAFLTTLDRYTAFAIDQRLPRLLEAGGASTALDEIDGMRTEHARVKYLGALGATARLTASELDRAMAIVTRLTSDQARLEGLLAIARRNIFEGERLDAYVNVAAALESVGERRRALNAINRR
jgi:beta-lactamase regulating signal transducer with metallopeptidase domain